MKKKKADDSINIFASHFYADLEAVILVRKGAVIPTVPVAQSTKDIDWSAVKNVKY